MLFFLFRSVLLFYYCYCIVTWCGVAWSFFSFLFLFVFLFLLFASLFGFHFVVVVVVVVAFVLCYLYGVFSHGTLWCCSCLDVWFTPPSPQPTLLLALTIPLHSPSHTRTHARTHTCACAFIIHTVTQTHNVHTVVR